MSQITYEQMESAQASSSGGSNVQYFSLKNDGDEAVVRIMHDSTADFDILTVHDVQVNGKYRKVSCVRDPREPLDKCALCQSGAKVMQRLYIHMIQYIKNADGSITAEPRVWERTTAYATTLRNLINEYGPLSNSIFKIRRNGAAGDMNTTYSILYGNPQIYSEEFYPKHAELIDGYKALGRAVMDKTPEEVAQYVATGNFPDAASSSTSAPVSIPTGTTTYVPPVTPTPVPTPAVNAGGVQRPVRYY